MKSARLLKMTAAATIIIEDENGDLEEFTMQPISVPIKQVKEQLPILARQFELQLDNINQKLKEEEPINVVG